MAILTVAFLVGLAWFYDFHQDGQTVGGLAAWVGLVLLAAWAAGYLAIAAVLLVLLAALLGMAGWVIRWLSGNAAFQEHLRRDD